MIDAFCNTYNDGVSLFETSLLYQHKSHRHCQADIITTSIGMIYGWIYNALALAASRLVELGVVTIFPPGNEGRGGPYTSDDGASGKCTLSIASVEADVRILSSASFLATFNLEAESDTTAVP